MTTEELQGVVGIAPISESIFEIGSGRDASRGILSDRIGEAVEGKRGEAVQTAGPIGGDAGRTSVSEGKVNEEEALDIT